MWIWCYEVHYCVLHNTIHAVIAVLDRHIIKSVTASHTYIVGCFE